MRLEEVLPELRKGKKVRRKGWDIDSYVNRNSLHHIVPMEGLLSDDWQIVPDEGCKHVCEKCTTDLPKPEKIEPYSWGYSMANVKDVEVQYALIRLTNYLNELVAAINSMREEKK